MKELVPTIISYIERQYNIEHAESKSFEIVDGKIVVKFAQPTAGSGVGGVKSEKKLVAEPAPIAKPEPITKRQKAEAIAALRETIASAQRIIQEEGERMEKRRERKEALLRELELVKDKIKNPFKHFVIDNMHPAAFFCLYQRKKEEVTLENINYVSGNNITGEDGKRLCFLTPGLTPEFITAARNDSVYLSSNGFSLQLLNKDEVTDRKGGKKVVMVNSLKAKYMLVYPDWTHDSRGDGELNLEKGKILLEQRAQQYQERQISLFEKQSKQV